MINNLNKKIKFSLIGIIIIFAFFTFGKTSLASTEIYFQKETKDIKEGNTFLANLKISSEKIVNTIDGTITYDKDKLEIKKVKTDNSLLSLWIKEPIINNETGELSFIGGIPDGFEGKDGQILEITFLAKKEGSTLVGFKDIFSVFKNDGLGTQINPWLKPMTIIINKNINYIQYALGFIFILVALFTIIKLLKKFRKNGK